MKKSLFIYLVGILFFFSSCKNAYEKNLETMNNRLKTFFETEAFKANQTIDLIEFKPIEYTCINENNVDSLAVLNNMKKYLYYDDLVINQTKLVKNLSNQVGLSQDIFGKNDKFTHSIKDDLEDAFKKLKEYQDSCVLCKKRDSILRQRIISRKDPKFVYQLKSYIKATIKDNNTGKSNNISDTVYYFFDTNLEIIKEITGY